MPKESSERRFEYIASLDEAELDRVRDDLHTVKERVFWLLRRFPFARNNDLFLILMYIRFFVPEFSQYIRYIPTDELMKLCGQVNLESIRRARQYIQNTLGYFPPTNPRVRRRRQKREKAFRRIFGRREI